MVAVDKPPGMLVHPSRIALDAEIASIRLQQQLEQPVFPIHRLDRPTSGVLLFAKDSKSARQLTQQFQARTVRKRYEAVVRGFPPDQGVWDEALLEKPDRVTDRQARADKPPQPATTEFQTLQCWQVPFPAGHSPKYPTSRYALVSILPRTGRKHQIRRHFNHMAHPILGDTTHGDRRHNRVFRDQLGVQRLMLVARELEICHPVNGQPIIIEASLGTEFKNALDALNKASILPKAES